MRYYEILHQLQQSVAENPLLEVVETDLSEGLAEKYLGNLTQRFGIQPSPDLLSFYQEVGSFRLTWRIKDESSVSHEITWPTPPFGNIDILAIDEYFGFDESYQVRLDDDKTLYYFDYYNRDSQEAACLVAEKGIIQPHLYLSGLEIGVVDTGLTIPQYIERLSRNKGFSFWQRGLPEENNQYAAQVGYYIPQLFPS